jgi:DNA polymerase III delta subunit
LGRDEGDKIMIYLLHGENFKESRKKLHSLVGSLFKKEPDVSKFLIDNESFSKELLEEMISGQTLFAGRYIVIVDKVFENKEAGEVVLEKLKLISKSENIFLFIEEKINKAILSRFKKWAEKIQEFPLKSEKKDNKFNIFGITDALGRRDRKGTWVLYQKALSEGIQPEEVHGILVWQIKNLLMVKDEKETGSLGLNPFVLRKSLGFASKYKKKELVKLSEELIRIPHESRRGMEDFNISLEKFILSF